jgi:hypothetical protein
MLRSRKKFRRLSKWRKCFEVGKDKVSFAKLTMHMIPKIYKSMRCTLLIAAMLTLKFAIALCVAKVYTMVSSLP